MFKLLTSVFVVVLLGGTGVSFIAEASQPGNFLYPVKTEVNERVRGWFTISYVADINLQVELLEERLAEVETLVKEGKLTPELAGEAQAKIISKIQTINESTKATYISDLSAKDKQRLSEALGRLQVALIKYKDSLATLDVEAKKSSKRNGSGGGKSTAAVVGEAIIELSEEASIEVEGEVEVIVSDGQDDGINDEFDDVSDEFEVTDEAETESENSVVLDEEEINVETEVEAEVEIEGNTEEGDGTDSEI